MANTFLSPRAQALMRLLRQEAGRRIIMGQQDTPRKGGSLSEIRWIKAACGSLPAMLGLDFIHDDYEGVTEQALKWNDAGGIVTVCWHTGIQENTYPACKGETADWDELFTPGSASNRLLMARWDRGAESLSRLRDADVPVMYRPFHEFDGTWFWWSKGGGERFVRLWRMMHDYYTQSCGLDNLIWVLGYADDVLDGWNPGEDYFDIAGSDTYRGETVHAAAYARLKQLCPDKILCFHECGLLPAVDSFFEQNAPWSYIMPWHGGVLFGNDPERVKQVYADERIITLERLKEMRAF
ncbi:MAG: hypothetical protein II920_02505 [Clostridia bacterium]|nr:hypothetical protein [Clostridia bacterium]